MAAVIREAVEHYVPDEERAAEDRVRRAREAIGRYRSDASDVSERHDDYLAEDPRGW
jgi:3-methyladenine DNA glycosylase/8-oxoguanine DNA glycosylase